MNVEAIAVQEIPQLLGAWLAEPVEVEVAEASARHELDVVVRSGELKFVMEVKRSDDVALIGAAAHQLASYSAGRPDAVPVLVVPYMGPKGRDYARSKGLSWMDLSGNADIRGPGLRILVQGQPNRFAAPGRPSTAFSDRASRLSRVMLVEPERWWRQHDLVERTGLSSGYVSKVVGRMVEDDLVEQRRDGGLIRPRSPDLLLDAWAQVYDFRKHDILRYHAVGRTGEAVLQALASKLAGIDQVEWAATGLAAAWKWSPFADFRLVTIFVSQPLLRPDELSLRPVERGENVWVVVPRDEGVFYGAEVVDGIRCVHPVQVYLDLLGHPERADEAAQHLRANGLSWAG